MSYVGSNGDCYNNSTSSYLGCSGFTGSVTCPEGSGPEDISGYTFAQGAQPAWVSQGTTHECGTTEPM